MPAPDAHRAVLRALDRMLPEGTAILTSEAEPWASATFSGARHLVLVECVDLHAAVDIVSALPEHEFSVPGHIMIDANGLAAGTAVAVELLTVEDR
ncbi:hypothetical protein ABC347_15100 [Sphingomonas sp. 1P06PA]|uniref:hypothetical protein n=1 Tax=Sphingomonas sp. 1P06PA TaxID=554121 RepID=UPI0039A6986A